MGDDVHRGIDARSAPGDTSMTDNDGSPILLTAKEAWTLCRMKKTSWYKNLALKAIPQPVRIKGMVRWRKDEILDWIEAGCPTQSKWRWVPQKKGKK